MMGSESLHRISYYAQIASMMFGFGDSHSPNPETVRLIESITLSQMKLILNEASKHVGADNTISDEHLVFLMRKSKFKMMRFIRHLKHETPARNKPLEKPIVRHHLLNFIEYIDETGELCDLEMFDEVKHERLIRADRLSQCWDLANYMKFHHARIISFKSKSATLTIEKLRQWIDPECRYKITIGAWDVISYLAYETVAGIVDYAMLVRTDHNRTPNPLGNTHQGHLSGTIFNSEHKLSTGIPDHNQVYGGQPAISVSEIKEVMRRLNTPQAGQLYFSRQPPPAKPVIIAL